MEAGGGVGEGVPEEGGHGGARLGAEGEGAHHQVGGGDGEAGRQGEGALGDAAVGSFHVAGLEGRGAGEEGEHHTAHSPHLGGCTVCYTTLHTTQCTVVCTTHYTVEQPDLRGGGVAPAGQHLGRDVVGGAAHRAHPALWGTGGQDSSTPVWWRNTTKHG